MLIHGYSGTMASMKSAMVRQRSNLRRSVAAEAIHGDGYQDYSTEEPMRSSSKLADDEEDLESPRLRSATSETTQAGSPFMRLNSAKSGCAAPCTLCSSKPGTRGGESGVYQWWRHKLEDCLWLASAAFILYYGDLQHDFFTILANDARVLRIPLHVGAVCFMVDICIVMIYITMNSHRDLRLTFSEAELHDSYNLYGDAIILIQAHTFVQVTVMALGSLAFALMCYSLWPIWSFLTIPMLFTLLMAFTVVAPYIAPCSDLKVHLVSPLDYKDAK
ncbi:hypothetical protein KP509_11G096200 [Ceratopteris richardii]|uniref:Uncharacterized protein n=1 Tax=Ceratopteris richardii TaxID=49495 RepID=A0A8T2TV83_CERRI|nr:hypothetical protein KP509_11G096200 [Ceratopteris richardii]